MAALVNGDYLHYTDMEKYLKIHQYYLLFPNVHGQSSPFESKSNLSSADTFNFNQSKIVPFGYEVKRRNCVGNGRENGQQQQIWNLSN